MVILLSGGGSGEKSKEIDLAFINKINKNKPVLYIPLARNAPYDSCMTWIKSNFKSLDFDNFEIIDDPKKLKNIDLSKYSGIYIGGGNTYKLLKELQDSKFMSVLKKYIQRGGIFYGGSAGAIILGMDIGTSDSKDGYETRDNKGLRLVGKFSVFCHYKKEDDQKIKNYIKQTQNKVLAIPENAGVLIDNSQIKTIGPGEITVFVKETKKDISSDASLRLE
jgi:dipeptidase E